MNKPTKITFNEWYYIFTLIGVNLTLLSFYSELAVIYDSYLKSYLEIFNKSSQLISESNKLLILEKEFKDDIKETRYQKSLKVITKLLTLFLQYQFLTRNGGSFTGPYTQGMYSDFTKNFKSPEKPNNPYKKSEESISDFMVDQQQQYHHNLEQIAEDNLNALNNEQAERDDIVFFDQNNLLN